MSRKRINYRDYPPNWRELRQQVMERAHWQCEGSPAYPTCRAQNGQPHPVTGSIVMLTTAHLYENDTMTQDISRLRGWCQRCHLHYDRPKHLRRAAETRRQRRLAAGQLMMEYAP